MSAIVLAALAPKEKGRSQRPPQRIRRGDNTHDFGDEEDVCPSPVPARNSLPGVEVITDELLYAVSFDFRQVKVLPVFVSLFLARASAIIFNAKIVSLPLHRRRSSVRRRQYGRLTGVGRYILGISREAQYLYSASFLQARRMSLLKDPKSCSCARNFVSEILPCAGNKSGRVRGAQATLNIGQ